MYNFRTVTKNEITKFSKKIKLNFKRIGISTQFEKKKYIHVTSSSPEKIGQIYEQSFSVCIVS